MEAISSVLIAKALDGLSTRYEVTAENIANAGTPNYRARRVDFEDSLRAAAAVGADAVAKVTPRIEMVTSGGFGGELRVDLEIATASQTAGRYAALLDVLGRTMQLSRVAIGAGQQ